MNTITVERVREVLAKKINGYTLTFWGMNPGGGDSVRYYVCMDTPTSHRIMTDDEINNLATENGFNDGWELIRYAEKFGLVRGSYIR